MLLRSRRTKRGGIISARHLFMRVLSVVPRRAVTVGSLKGGTVIGKTPEERGKLHLGFQTFPPSNHVAHDVGCQTLRRDVFKNFWQGGDGVVRWVHKNYIAGFQVFRRAFEY